MSYSAILDLVARKSGAPGGGTVGALAAAAGAALVALACRAAGDTGGGGADPGELSPLALAAESLARRLCFLAEEDQRAYERWQVRADGRTLEKSAGRHLSDWDSGVRGEVGLEAGGPEEGIMAVPCQIGAACLELVELAGRAKGQVSRPDLRADLRIATLLVVASGRAALELMEVNRPELPPEKSWVYARMAGRIVEGLDKVGIG
ncbi:MAG: cyclodeaminase/cyclohydrolase family protein [Thermoleophilia bacterium]|nr:cyclodeaminase/cyclohydrolase family protein [Thermoleophilia bacterium]